MSYEIGFIGAGNMAEAIARGVIKSGLFRANKLIASDVSADRRKIFEEQLQVKTSQDNAGLARESKVLMLCVKPQYMQAALENIGAAMSDQTLVISIAAGIGSRFIEQQLGNAKRWRIVRTMPNTPMLVGEGMVAIAPGANATAQDLAAARRIFEAAATVVEVTEDKIDAVTALSGSGPAYFFFLVEQMIAAGVQMGLTPDQAHQLATRTALGAGKMLATSSDSPQELRRKVTSPGGTTHAAISHMESQNVGPAIVQAILAAQRRGKELGK
ncbi:MAG TPA: pyrroline-5-carboxylate reductase [Humisphaera sp.]|jgi:pyrroline-5-carboxylate reductase|nr:pyrroline-5-carboxylate reductase [Humisphaera sp.]